jgi:hypothetical protein
MAIQPQVPLTPEERQELARLAQWAALDEHQAERKLIEAGLAALRLEAALHLYATTPLSTGEIAERARVPRGYLLRMIQERRIAPYDDPTIDRKALFRDLDQRLQERMERRQRPQ